jgi:hypothetical protein
MNMNFDTMDAGPEMNTLIAEKILGLSGCSGWKWINLGSAGGPALEKICTHPNGTCFPTEAQASMFGTIGGPPNVSCSDRESFELVDNMKARRESFQFSLSSEPTGINVGWRAVFWAGEKTSPHRKKYDPRDGFGYTYAIGEAKTRPEAICRAALKAILG